LLILLIFFIRCFLNNIKRKYWQTNDTSV
jgi:hypothetical protein